MMEDERQFSAEVAEYFFSKGLEVVSCVNRDKAEELFLEQRFDLVLLDIMIKDKNGVEQLNEGYKMCQYIRERNKYIPVIFCSARNDEMDEKQGFDYGCHDYVMKPYSAERLYMRVKNMIIHTEILRRVGQKLTMHGITIDDGSKTAAVGGRDLQLSPKQFELLQVLMENAGQVISRDRLLTQVWNYGAQDDVRVVDRHIYKLKKALGDKAEHIKTKPGYGYWFEGEVE